MWAPVAPGPRPLVPLGARGTIGINQTGASHPGEDSPIVEPESHVTGKDAVSGGCTNGGWTVRISEAHAFLGQSIQMGSGHLGFGIVTIHITITKIVSKDEEDIGFISGI